MRRRLKACCTFQGIGLHTGEESRLKVGPAPWGAGYQVIWDDQIFPLNEGGRRGDGRGTTLQFGAHRWMTVEHLLSAVVGMELDDVSFYPLKGDEAPLIDGSALPFVQEFENVGIEEGEGEPDWLNVDSPIWVNSEDGHKTVGVLPFDGLRVTYAVDYPVEAVGCQMVTLDLTSRNYAHELGQCRTFCLENELDQLVRAGLAKGGSLENALVIGQNGPLNPNGYRIDRELVRHKTLDFLGDLALTGKRPRGHFFGVRAGHEMHLRLVEKLQQRS